jgi:hypothetical protein
MDLHWKLQPEMMQSLTQGVTPRESLMRILPMILERQTCQNDALNINMYDGNDDNDVDHTMVDKSGDLSVLFAAIFRKKS